MLYDLWRDVYGMALLRMVYSSQGRSLGQIRLGGRGGVPPEQVPVPGVNSGVNT